MSDNAALRVRVAGLLGRMVGRDYKRAGDLHDACEDMLRLDGMSIEREYPVKLPNGTSGFIDLVVSIDGARIAIELDNRTMRTKSVRKLNQEKFDLRVGVLRTGHVGGEIKPVAGLDLLVCVGSKSTREIRALSRGEAPEFYAWYDAYPRRVSQADARDAWEETAAIRPPLAEMLATLAWQAAQFDWMKEGGRYVPHPSSYLRGKRWTDQRPVTNGTDAHGRTAPPFRPPGWEEPR